MKTFCRLRTLPISCVLFSILYVGSLQWTALSHATAAPGKTTPADDPAAQLFLRKCAGCHTIGGGALIGPDLAAVQPRSQADITASIKRMQDRVGPLTDTEVQVFTTLLRDKTAASRLLASQQPVQPAQAAPSTLATRILPSNKVGRRLFSGALPLEHGGMACSSCHRAAGTGGTIGQDLTDVSARFEQAALVAGIQEANHTVMHAMFRRHPITQQEAAHLASYLHSLTGARKTAFDVFGLVPIVGLLVALGLLAVMPRFYRERNMGARARLVNNRRFIDFDRR